MARECCRPRPMRSPLTARGLRVVRFLAVALALALPACAAEPPGYYAAALGKSGPALRGALHGIIRNHTALPYSAPPGTTDTSDALAVIDQDPANASRVDLVYSDLTMAKSPFGQAATWNREHLWPQSYGIDGVEPAYSDLRNLRACDTSVNSERANLPYDDSDEALSSYSAPAHVEAAGTSRDGNSWEPLDSEKGDLARAMFYMDVRYEGDVAGEPDLFLTDNLAQVTSNGSAMGRLSTLLVWNLLDPVDAAERARNDAIDSNYQHNRNPFVDHPEWISALFGELLRLDFSRANGNVTLRWPAGYARLHLQVSDDLRDWQDVTEIPALQGTEHVLVRPAGTVDRVFYRLMVR